MSNHQQDEAGKGRTIGLNKLFVCPEECAETWGKQARSQRQECSGTKPGAEAGTEPAKQLKYRLLEDPEEARLGASRSVRVGYGVPAVATCV